MVIGGMFIFVIVVLNLWFI